MSEAKLPRILIVDDEIYNVDLIEAYLTPDYEVIKAYDGEEGLRLAGEGVDLILLDIMMPGLSGYEVCSILKNNEETRHIPIIMITALFEDKDRQEALAAGADEFLSKPVEQIELETRIRTLLRTKKLSDCLIAEKKQCQNYLEIAGVLIVVLDENGDVVLINKKGLETLGYEEEEVIGRNWFEYFLPEGVSGDLRDVFRKIMSGEMHLDEYYENPIACKDGSERIISWQNSSLIDDNGQIYGILSSGEDITEKKKAEAALRMYMSELQHSNDLKDLFIDIMRHDLLNSAGLVKGFASVLLKDPKDDKQKHVIETLLKNNEKMIDLINQASKFAKVESLEKVDLCPVNLSDILRDVLDSMGEEIEEKGVNVVNIAPQRCLAIANPIVGEVFLNYISNAIKYSPEGEQVSIDIKDAGDFWKFTVTDRGEGIESEDKIRVFERFSRVNKVNVKGMGVGLAIVKRIVDLHGGEVGVTDNPEGKGSVFWATIPKA
ncbi:PAS domain S-box-containing protein [Methanohalophilus levihalophilus]|uniref:sensor histidine kinase n=1 Tax=Methanohalophilus levihalophilus TaxID=1431282 RepID=UPI001AE9C360|nr:response regulator [Methanohalophilus levihalophilus]MBP2030169.1 PAS domain S-box-containing protein [Methanohalophilus levihalophilus]